MGSSRLPNKMMLHLNGYPIIEWVYRRVIQSKKIDQIVFALPVSNQDDVLALYLSQIGATVFRGSELDVVSRYYAVAREYNATEIVRICADNPLICPKEIDFLIEKFYEIECDYAYNHIPKNNTYPDGLGAEICHMDLVKTINIKASTPEHREHLFNYMWDNKEGYRIFTFNPKSEISHPELKFDIDTLEDYRLLVSRNYRIDMTAEEIIEVATSSSEKGVLNSLL